MCLFRAAHGPSPQYGGYNLIMVAHCASPPFYLNVKLAPYHLINNRVERKLICY